MKHTVLAIIASVAFAASSFAVEKGKVDFIVGVDGDFKAAMAAAAAAKPTESNRFIIFFPDGEYDIGSATGNSNQMTEFKTSYVSFIGQSTEKTILYNKSIEEGISVTATLYLHGSGIYMQDMTILNMSPSCSRVTSSSTRT